MDIFKKEDEILKAGKNLLEQGVFSAAQDEDYYRVLLQNYKRLLKQMKSMVRISDLTQAELKDLSHKLEVMSTTDSLTGLYNRRYFNEIFQKEYLSALRSQVHLAVLMIDIDYYKKYNDTYGHLQGDQCLLQVAQAVQKNVKRPRDIVARYGGEEFVVLLAETGDLGGKHIAEQIIQSVAELRINHEGSPKGVVTVSIGVRSAIPQRGDYPDKILNEADEALYRAKDSGRNTICF